LRVFRVSRFIWFFRYDFVYFSAIFLGYFVRLRRALNFYWLFGS
jgi:hypothetical protein